MNSIYDDFYNQAFELQGHTHDRMDVPDHPQAITLKHQIHQLTEDIKSEKNPRHLYDSLEKIETQLQQAQSSSQPVMSYQDLEDLKHRFRRMRENVRKLPNY